MLGASTCEARMDLTQLQQQLTGLAHYPLEQWTPPFCGAIPIRIDRDGRWFYQQSPIERQPLVKLFAAVLCRDEHGYVLKTPVEKVQIQVDDAPFVLIDAEWQPSTAGPLLQVVSNLGQNYLISAEYPVKLQAEPLSGELLPYLQLPRGLSAKFSRSLFYRLAELASSEASRSAVGMVDYVIYSGSYRCVLGQSEAS